MHLEDILTMIQSVGGKKRFGAGIVVDPCRILTCSHVVNAALGRRMDESSRPTGDVLVTLHSSSVEGFIASVDSGPDAWNAPPAGSRRGADLCLLRLAKAIDVQPAILLTDENFIRREFRAGGYPQDWEGDLDIAIGEIVGRDEHGLYLLRPHSSALAVYAAEDNRFVGKNKRPVGVIHSGFSGGPVEVDGKIAGVIAEARASTAQATAYMVAASVFPKSVLPSDNLSDTKQHGREFVNQFAPGPMVKETYLITPELIHNCARAAEQRSDAAAILNSANRLRSDLGRSEESTTFGLLEFFALPNIDAGAGAFWSECLLRACVFGPRMLASLLVSLPEGLFDEQAKRDLEAILDLLLDKYRIQNDEPLTAVDRKRRGL
jgi:hypothetical protein